MRLWAAKNGKEAECKKDTKIGTGETQKSLSVNQVALYNLRADHEGKEWAHIIVGWG